jgi:hypothetical protein
LRCAFEQSKFLASQGVASWFHFADKGFRQISDIYEVKSTLFMMDQLKEVHIQKWISDLQRAGSKRATYLEISGGIFEARAYLEEIKSKANRRMLACFRTGSHMLRVETGRWSNEAQITRVCPVCSSGAVEDEKHLVFECPSYDEIRSKIRFSHIFKEPSSLSSVLQKNSPLVCEFLSLCFELREGLLA